MEYLLIFFSAAVVNNFVLVRFLGICPFMGVSRQMDTAVGMGMATTFVMLVAATVSWLIQSLLLAPFGLEYLRTVAFILVIASMVQLVELFVRKASPSLYKALGIFLPLITTNCAILGMALLLVMRDLSFLQSLFFSLGAGAGFTLALVLIASLREELEFADVPKPLQGAAIAFIVAGILSMAFGGFAGMAS